MTEDKYQTEHGEFDLSNGSGRDPGGVPIDDIRELVGELEAKRDWHSECARKEGDAAHSGKCRAFQECIEQLEEVIEQYE